MDSIVLLVEVPWGPTMWQIAVVPQSHFSRATIRYKFFSLLRSLVYRIRSLLVTKQPRTRSLGTKLAPDEYAAVEAYASKHDMNVSEWCREVLLAKINQQPQIEASGTDDQIVLAEILAIRAILVNVLYKYVNGKTITAEEMQRLIERADAEKLKKALERLLQPSTVKEI